MTRIGTGLQQPCETLHDHVGAFGTSCAQKGKVAKRTGQTGFSGPCRSALLLC